VQEGIEDNNERYKAQVLALQSKLLDEQQRRQRADERVQALKEYAERAKTRYLEEEGFNKELKTSVEALQAKVLKYMYFVYKYLLIHVYILVYTYVSEYIPT
jgi:hypothetical protein